MGLDRSDGLDGLERLDRLEGCLSSLSLLGFLSIPLPYWITRRPTCATGLIDSNAN